MVELLVGLRGAMVDRGRFLRRGKAGDRVGGETPHGTRKSAFFKCRVSEVNDREVRDNDIRFTQYQRDVTIIADIKDELSRGLRTKSDMRIEIESEHFSGIYRIVGKPQRVRAKRRLKLWVIDAVIDDGKDATRA